MNESCKHCHGTATRLVGIVTAGDHSHHILAPCSACDAVEIRDRKETDKERSEWIATHRNTTAYLAANVPGWAAR